MKRDTRAGGTFKISFTNFSNQQVHSFGNEYIDLMPDKLLRYTDTFDDPSLTAEMQEYRWLLYWQGD